MRMMILGVVAPPPAGAKILGSSSFTYSSSRTKIALFQARDIFPFTTLKRRGRGSLIEASCSNNDNFDDQFDGFSVLSADIPWDYENVWSTFAAYFFSLHIPLSFGGLSVIAQVFDQPTLDPLEMVISTLALQMAEAVGAMTLLRYTSKQHHLFFINISRMFLSSEGRSSIKASALGTLFLIGLALFTSALADKLVGPKEINNPILRDILQHSPTSATLCFILYCIVAPLLEETVYRGFLLTSLASKKKWWQAVVISSCAFSIAHFSVDNSLQLFVIGCVLGSVYCWTGNLAASCAVHSVYNMATLLVTMMSVS